MKVSEVISRLIACDKTERPVCAVFFTRDSEGNVLSKKYYPINAVFSHRENEAHIYIEEASLLSEHEL